jgi:UDPglucose 6-dehydrogenase
VSRIFIVGAGLVGASTGRALLDAGHQVTFIDTDPARVAELRAGGLDARPDLVLAREPESMVLLTLPTPGVGHGYDLSALRLGAQLVAAALRDADRRHTVVVRSTVPPGTTDGMVRHVLERGSGRLAGEGFDLVANPEFLRPDRADADARFPLLTVIGASDRRAADRFAALVEPFGGTTHVLASAAAAEMVKAAHTLRRATEVRFWAELAAVSARVGVDVDDVAGVLLDEVPAADEYLTKDAEGFLGFATDRGVPMPLAAAVVATAEADRQATRTLPRTRRSQEEQRPRAITLDTRSVVASNGRV